MVSAALLATMVALATPVAHGSFNLNCSLASDSGVAAWTLAWDSQISMTPRACSTSAAVIEHRAPLTSWWGLPLLLHEAAHIGQWRESRYAFADPAQFYEHDAECRMLGAFARAARAIDYRAKAIRDALWVARTRVLNEPPPYGGSCLKTARPVRHPSGPLPASRRSSR